MLMLNIRNTSNEVLSWNKQIDITCIKLGSANDRLSKSHHFVSLKTYLLVYYSIFHSHLLYVYVLVFLRVNQCLSS